MDRRTDAGLVEVAGQAGRFVVVGLANTLVTGALFYMLAFAMPPWLAYTIAFGLGVGFAVAVTPRFVFLVRPRAQRRAAYALWYVVVYVVGLGLVHLLDDIVRADRGQVVVLTVATTALLSFVGGRAILMSRASQGES